MSSLTAFCIAGWALTLPLGHFMVHYAYQAHLCIDKGSRIEAQILIVKALGTSIFGGGLATLMFSLRWQIHDLVWPAIYATVVTALAFTLQLRARYRLRHE